jgi:hypothetical protein
VSTGKLKQIDEKFIPGETFGHNIEITEMFNAQENPAPISFHIKELNASAYKISDTVYTIKQLQEGVTFIINGIEENSLNTEIDHTDGIGSAFSFESGNVFAIFEKSGEFEEDGFSLIVPETGTYYTVSYGEVLPKDLIIETKYIGSKKIIDKFISELNWSKIKNKPFGDKELIEEVFIMEEGKKINAIHVGGEFSAFKLFNAIPTKQQVRDGLVLSVGSVDDGEDVLTTIFSNATFIDTDFGFVIITETGAQFAIISETGEYYYEVNFSLSLDAPGAIIPAAITVTEEDLGFYIWQNFDLN